MALRNFTQSNYGRISIANCNYFILSLGTQLVLHQAGDVSIMLLVKSSTPPPFLVISVFANQICKWLFHQSNRSQLVAKRRGCWMLDEDENREQPTKWTFKIPPKSEFARQNCDVPVRHCSFSYRETTLSHRIVVLSWDHGGARVKYKRLYSVCLSMFHFSAPTTERGFPNPAASRSLETISV